MNSIRKMLLAWRTRRRIAVATNAVYSEQFDLDAIVRSLACDGTSADLLQTYVAIRVAADAKLGAEVSTDAVLEEISSSGMLPNDPDACRTILELRKSQAAASLLKAEIEFSADRLAPEFSYRGALYRAEKNKKGPLSFKEREKLRAMTAELAEIDRKIESIQGASGGDTK